MVMKKTSFLFLLGLTFCAQLCIAQSDVSLNYLEYVSIDSLKADLSYLASPDLKGRGNGSITLDIAGDYIREQFKQAGLLPYLSDFKQPFEWKTIAKRPVLTIGSRTYTYDVDYFPATLRQGRDKKTRDVAFVSNDPENWLSQTRLYENKTVILIPGLADNSDSTISALSACIKKAEELNAGMLLIPSLHFVNRSTFNNRNQYISYFQNFKLTSDKIPVAFISWDVIQDILGDSTVHLLLRNYDHTELSVFGRKTPVQWQYHQVNVTIPANNIVGFIPGVNQRQLMVIGAHYDHAGDDGRHIFYGADDNASGTAGLIQLARMFANAARHGNQPQVNVVFIAFSAEETGLKGSQYFVSAVPPDRKIVAMINMDMIGRKGDRRKTDDERLAVVGSDWHPRFWETKLKNAEDLFPAIKLDYSIKRFADPEMLTLRSDQFPFLKSDIPSIFFHDNMTKDYHKPGDVADKIEWNLLKERIQFIFLTAWQVAFSKS